MAAATRNAQAPKAPKAPKAPNVQPNELPPIFLVEVLFGGLVIGEVDVPQAKFLSSYGNINYKASVRRDLRLPEEGEAITDGDETHFVRDDGFDPATALELLTFRARGVDLEAGEVYTSEPKMRDGKQIGGGNLTVCHVGTINLTDDVKHRIEVRGTNLGAEKGFSLFIETRRQPKPGQRPVVEGFVRGLQVAAA